MAVRIHVPGSRLYFTYGDERIAFERVLRASSSTKVLIKVHPDCRVEVAASPNASDAEVIEAVRKQARWIYEKRRDFKKHIEHVTPRKYVSGETHYYLGKQYVLKVIEQAGATQGVRLLGGKIEVTVRQKSAKRVRELLDEWYKARSRDVFSKRLDALLESTLWVTGRPQLRLLTMKTQWGSCSPSGTLTLNPLLVKAPRECIDYVILHELCHIAEHNHSERFYRLMGQVMPRWEKTKERLDGMANLLMSD